MRLRLRVCGVPLLDVTFDRAVAVEPHSSAEGVDVHLMADTQPTPRGFGFIPAPIEFDKPQPENGSTET